MPRTPLYPHIPARASDPAIEDLVAAVGKSGCPGCARYLERVRALQRDRGSETALAGMLRHWRHHVEKGAHPHGTSLLDYMWTL